MKKNIVITFSISEAMFFVHISAISNFLVYIVTMFYSYPRYKVQGKTPILKVPHDRFFSKQSS